MVVGCAVVWADVGLLLLLELWFLLVFRFLCLSRLLKIFAQLVRKQVGQIRDEVRKIQVVCTESCKVVLCQGQQCRETSKPIFFLAKKKLCKKEI